MSGGRWGRRKEQQIPGHEGDPSALQTSWGQVGGGVRASHLWSFLP